MRRSIAFVQCVIAAATLLMALTELSCATASTVLQNIHALCCVSDLFAFTCPLSPSSFVTSTILFLCHDLSTVISHCQKARTRPLSYSIQLSLLFVLSTSPGSSRRAPQNKPTASRAIATPAQNIVLADGVVKLSTSLVHTPSRAHTPSELCFPVIWAPLRTVLPYSSETWRMHYK